MPGIATNSIHAADHKDRVTDVAPPINVSTTFRYSDNPAELVKCGDLDPEASFLGTPVYSRLTHPNSELVEEVLGAIAGSEAVVYSSGLSAIFAALTHYNPKRLAIGLGYHGTHHIANIFTRLSGLHQLTLVREDLDKLQQGDVLYIETPVNPDGEVFDIQYFADIAHSHGAHLVVDSTFAPPPLLDPFAHGADMVVHSATKYFGGHSDLLAGVLFTKSANVKNRLTHDRLCLGTIIANLESYLLIRSLRTFELRILRQSSNATKLVAYLSANRTKWPRLINLSHGSLQSGDFIKKQMPNGHSPVFALELETEQLAKEFPSRLKFFHHATSLGGVESLIEWRAMSDSECSPRLLRVSVGVENIEDLIEDFSQALNSLL